MAGEKPPSTTCLSALQTTTLPAAAGTPSTDTVNRSVAGAFAGSPSSASSKTIAIPVPDPVTDAETGSGPAMSALVAPSTFEAGPRRRR